MTARSRSRLLAVAAPMLAGCFCGHLLAYGRRRAEADAIREVDRAATGVVVGWDGRVTDDAGATLGRGMWWSAIRERGRDVAGAEPTRGAALPSCSGSPADDGCVDVVRDVERDVVLRVRDRSGDYDVPLARLTRTWTAPWAYALLPAALVADALTVPFFIVMTPAALILGD